MSSLEAVELVDRIWARDSTVWTGRDEAHWLGWLDEPGRMLERLDELEGLDRDFDDVVLLGMGGSSLGPEVIRRTFGITRLHVLDTTHPTAIRRLEQEVDLDRTLFVGASKSGTTLETRSQLDYFLERGQGTFGAITDPGTELEQFAREHDFAFVVNGEPTIGGRYSVLSPFGMVPAALLDLDVKMLLERADAMSEWCRLGEENPGFAFGLQLGEGWSEGRDKICIDETPGGFGLWAEQLIAESTGKEGKGLVPAPGEDPEAGRRPPARARAARRSVRPRSRVLPLGVRDRGRGLDPRHQPVRPAGRPGREGPDERHPLVRPGPGDPRQVPKGHWTSCSPTRSRRTTSQSRRSSTPRERVSSTGSSTGRARQGASSRRASAPATCTRRVSCTRAGRTRSSPSRSWTTSARSWRFPGANSASGS